MARHASPELRERKRLIEIVAIVLTSLLLIGLSRLEIRLFELSGNLARNQEFFSTIIYYGLINLNVVLILFLGFLIFRNVARLVVERRRGVIGSRLRAKLVLTLVFFALAPTLLFFYVSARYITRSFDEWFSEKVKATMQQTREAGATVYRQDQRRHESLARIALQRVIVSIPSDRSTFGEPWVKADGLKGFAKEYGVDAVAVYDTNGDVIWAHGTKERTAQSLEFVASALTRFREQPGLVSMSAVEGEEGQDVVKGVAPIVDTNSQELLGIVLTETRFETQILKSIESIQASFAALRPGAQLIRLSYIILLVLMALLILFCAVWLGFNVAREISGPLQSLAEATREVALGNYGVSLASRTDDEVGQLVRSFNQMTRDLQNHRVQAESASAILRQTNLELDERRRHMEVILKNVSTGVMSADAAGTITSMNNAAERLLNLRARDVIGKSAANAFDTNLIETLWTPLLDRLRHARTFSGQIEITLAGRELTMLVESTKIFDEQGNDLGFVMVFDDATQQVKAQKVAAWREVARRIAHEIKNPVTPIKLSAQRLLRRFHNRFQGEEQEVFASCVETILKQVDSLRDLVNEFSKFARLPSVQPKMGDINELITEIVGMYKMSYPNVQFGLSGLGKVPEVPIDKEQFGRVFVNLITNSIAAFDGKAGMIEFRTFYLPDVNTIRVEVLDDGHGIPDSIRDRVLEPYFSTKDEGTGLGLAIVNQIVSDHGGYLRIAPNDPKGTKVIIELPAQANSARRA